MKNFVLSAAVAAMIAMPVAAFAETPNPADPAPSNPTSTSGAKTEAPAKAGGEGAMMKKHHGKKHKHMSHGMMRHHMGAGKMTGHKTF